MPHDPYHIVVPNRANRQARMAARLRRHPDLLRMKVLFGMALRQATGLVGSLLRLIGLDWPVPDFSTLSPRQKTLKGDIRCSPPERSQAIAAAVAPVFINSRGDRNCVLAGRSSRSPAGWLAKSA